MKLLVVLAAFAALCAGNAIPLVPLDNSHYVEGESRYIWMPDGEGTNHLVDLKAPVDHDFLQSRDGSNNQYWLYTRRNPTTAQIIVHGDSDTIWNSNYLSSLPLMVIVHGWNNNGDSTLNPAITAAYLAVADANVIVVDWSDLASSLYTTSAAGVTTVGEHLGNFLVWLIETGGGDWDSVHLVGHSLGAHVVGNAGRTTGSKPIRITGMDPAGPLFGSNSNALNTGDGQLVESIHTCGGILGIFEPISHLDFYPNGGKWQPGCLLPSCNHGRSHELFASSVRTNHFVGRLCDDIDQAENKECTGSTVNMGNSILTKTGSGIYGLTTESAWPY